MTWPRWITGKKGLIIGSVVGFLIDRGIATYQLHLAERESARADIRLSAEIRRSSFYMLNESQRLSRLRQRLSECDQQAADYPVQNAIANISEILASLDEGRDFNEKRLAELEGREPVEPEHYNISMRPITGEGKVNLTDEQLKKGPPYSLPPRKLSPCPSREDIEVFSGLKPEPSNPKPPA